MGSYWKPKGYHQLGQGEYVEITADDVLERFKEATGTKNMFELAEWLGVRTALICDVKRRNIMPVAWLQLLAVKRSEYNLVWLLTGQGKKLCTIALV